MSSPLPPKGSKRHRFRNAIKYGFEAILPPSRSTSPNPAANITSKVWTGLETALRVLETNAEAFTPLKSAIGGLLACLDIIQAAATNHEDYQELTSEFTAMAGILNQYMVRLGSEDPGSSVARIARSIGKEVECINRKQGRDKGRRLIESIQDKKDVTKRYRRIEGLFRQLQSEVSLRAWETNDKQFKASLLRDLAPVDEALYNSSYSTTIKRRGCTAETREKVQSDLQDWVRDPDAAKVYWMNGMAGTGKTTIAYSLCEWLEENQLLGASFFCSRVSSSCRNVNQIIPTIAYQLAQYSPAFRSSLCKALEEKMNAGKLNAVWQFKKLMQTPLQRVKSAMPEGVVVVIDALDECEDVYGVRLVLETLLKFAVDLPIKFFFTSRPEPSISDKMLSSSGYLPSVLHLHDIEESIVEGDIKKYLTESLSSMSSPPTPGEIEQLSKRAGKLFIYAATAVRYILPDDIRVNSKARLRAMLATGSPPAEAATPSMQYQELDALYTNILAIALDPRRLEAREIHMMRLALRTAVCAKEPMAAETLASLLGVTVEEVSSALQPLQSVLHVSSAGGYVSALHASFPDFMFDRTRSTDFYCDKAQHNELLAHRCFDLMKEQLQFNICNLDSSCVFDKDVPEIEERVKTYISPALFYACRYWGGHLELSGASDKLLSKLVDLLTHRLLFWMEVLNLGCCIVLMGSDLLLQAQDWLATNNATTDGKGQAADAQAFVTRFAASSCKQSTPHIYLSALPFCPRSSSVYKNYWGKIRGVIEVKGTAIRHREQAALVTWMTDSDVRTTAFSPDGTRIVSGSADGAIRVWDARSSDLIVGPLKGHTDEVNSVSISPDGTRIVSASDDCTIRVWDARTGDTVAGPLEGHTDPVQSSGDPIAEPYDGHTDAILSVSFSPDGTRIVSGSCDKTIRIWDGHSGIPLAEPFRGHTDKVWSVAFSPDSSRIASGSQDRTIYVWDVNTGNIVSGPLEGHTEEVFSVAFSPDGTRISSGSGDFTIRVWDIHPRATSFELFEGHAESVVSVAFSPDGTRIVSGSLDRTIRVWDARPTHAGAGRFHGHKNPVQSVSFSPDGARITSSASHTIYVWDSCTGEAISQPLEGHEGIVYSVSFSPDGGHIVSGSEDHTLRVWNVYTGDTIAGPFQGHADAVCSVGFSHDGNRIVSGSDDRTIRVWDVCTGATVAGPLEGHTDVVVAVAFSPDGTRIVSGSFDRTIRTWDLQAGGTLTNEFAGHSHKVRSVAFSPDGSLIASGSADHTVRLWDAWAGTTSAQPFQGHTDEVNSVAFSPDGTLIVSGSDDCTLRLWNAQTGEAVAGPFDGHVDVISSVAFSPSGTYIVSGSLDYTIRVWGARTDDITGPCRGDANHTNIDVISPVSTRVAPRSDNAVKALLLNDPASRNLDITRQILIQKPLTSVGGFTSRDDGWVTTDGIPLFWIPPDFRVHLPYPHNTLVIGPQGSAYIDYQNLRIGKQWSECYVPE